MAKIPPANEETNVVIVDLAAKIHLRPEIPKINNRYESNVYDVVGQCMVLIC
jgi:hypothetical protein